MSALELPRITVFPSSGDAVVSCYRDRLREDRRWIMGSLADIDDRLAAITSGPRPRRLDLVAHAADGILDFGGAKILATSGDVVKALSALARGGVELLCLVGCGTATKAGAQNVEDLQAKVTATLPSGKSLKILGTTVTVDGQYFGHEGLRRELEYGAFGLFKVPPAACAVFNLDDWFAANLMDRNHYHSINREQLTQLSGMIETDYLACCPFELGLVAGAPSLFTFQVDGPNLRQGGRARIVAAGTSLYVVAESGRPPEVYYRVIPGRRAELEALVTSWRESSAA